MLNTLIKINYNKPILNDISILENKVIAIDTNLYIYKYNTNNKLLEMFYKLCKLFIKHNIIPVFVFDGETPEEKKEELEKRKEKKKIAKEEYDTLEKLLDITTDKKERVIIIKKLLYLKKQYIKVKRTDIHKIKTLIRGFGLTVVDAPDEGEKLCCYLVNNNYCDGIFTEDSDAYVYGCKNIYRNISFVNNTIIKYEYDLVLESLSLTHNELVYLSIISQNDYNHTDKTILNNYNEFIEYRKLHDTNTIEKYIYDNYMFDKLKADDVLCMKDIYSYDLKIYSKYNKLFIKNGPINIDNISSIMIEENFIFV